MKSIIYIEGNRNGYTPDQCGRTLTVGELIEILQEYDEDAEIYLRNDNGYTYGSIRKCDIEATDDRGEEWE